MTRPDFIIIGAMKCGTSTLQAQIAAQDGVFMTTPKEPNFFSDDDVYERGAGWYAGLFSEAREGDLRGEASTHYTKLPTHPHTVERLAAFAPEAKFIYLMRHPVDRLVSHYIHEWSMAAAPGSIDEAAAAGSVYVDYGRYAFQLAPFIERFGRAGILPVFLERMTAEPDETLQRVAAFIGLGAAQWRDDLGTQNVSAERVRRLPLARYLIENETATKLRRRLAPQSLRNRIKKRLQMSERPELSDAARARIEAIFDEDLARLGAMLGVPLSCRTFEQAVAAAPLDWGAD